MPTERKLLPRDIRYVLEWAEKWRAIPTRKEIARALGVSEATVTRIARNGGYVPRKKPMDIEALVASIDAKSSVPQGTELNASHQGAGA